MCTVYMDILCYFILRTWVPITGFAEWGGGIIPRTSPTFIPYSDCTLCLVHFLYIFFLQSVPILKGLETRKVSWWRIHQWDITYVISYYRRWIFIVIYYEDNCFRELSLTMISVFTLLSPQHAVGTCHGLVLFLWCWGSNTGRFTHVRQAL